MPITINGSGTVTGLSVGGLPDGTVDSDTLAATARGKILQVASGTTSTEVIVNSTSYMDTGLSATITPASGTKVLVITDQQYHLERDTDRAQIYVQLLRGSTVIDSHTKGFLSTYGGSDSSVKLGGTNNYIYLDTHGANGSTALTYKIQGKMESTADDGKCKFQEGGNVAAYMYLMEVAA